MLSSQLHDYKDPAASDQGREVRGQSWLIVCVVEQLREMTETTIQGQRRRHIIMSPKTAAAAVVSSVGIETDRQTNRQEDRQAYRQRQRQRETETERDAVWEGGVLHVQILLESGSFC